MHIVTSQRSAAGLSKRPRSITGINWASPQAQGLIRCWPFIGTSILPDLARRQMLTMASPPLRDTFYPQMGPLGQWNQFLTTGQSATGSAVDFPLGAAPPFTMACRLWNQSSFGILQIYLMYGNEDGFAPTIFVDATDHISGTFFGGTAITGPVLSTLVQVDVVLTYDGATLRLYVNGVEVGTPVSATPTVVGTTLYVSRRAINTDLGIAIGALADVVIAKGAWAPSTAWAYTNPASRYDLYRVPTRRIFVQGVASVGVVKTWDGLAWASVKELNGLANASIKTVNGMAAQ